MADRIGEMIDGQTSVGEKERETDIGQIEEERKKERLKVSLSPSSNCPAKLLNILYIHVP